MNTPQLKYPNYILSKTYSPTPIEAIKSSVFKLIEQRQREIRYQNKIDSIARNTPTVMSDPLMNLRIRQYYREMYERTLPTEIAGRAAGAVEGAGMGAGLAAGIGGVVTGVGWLISALVPGDAGAFGVAASAAGEAIAATGKAVAAKAGAFAIGGAVAGGLTSDYSTYYATRDLLNNTFFKAFKTQNPLKAGLNTLASVGKSMDIAECGEAIRSIIYSVINKEDVLTNLRRAYGLDEEYGRKEFDFSSIRESMDIDLGGAGNIIFDMTGEVITDPGAFASIVGKGLADVDFQKFGKRIKSLKEVDEVIDTSGKAIKVTKNALGEFIDEAGNIVDAAKVVKAKTHWFTKLTGLDGTTVKKSISEIEDTIKESISTINSKNATKKLTSLVGDGNNSVTKQLAKIIRDGDDIEAKLYLTKVLNMPEKSKDVFSAFLNKIRKETARSTSVNFFRAFDAVDHVDDTLTGVLFKTMNGPVACMSMINIAPTFLNRLSKKFKFADNINKYIYGNQAPETIIQGTVNKVLESIQLSKNSKHASIKYFDELAKDTDYEPEFIEKLKSSNIYGIRDLTNKLIKKPNNPKLQTIKDGYISLFKKKSKDISDKIDVCIDKIRASKDITERKALIKESTELISSSVSLETQIKYLNGTIEDYQLQNIMSKIHIINAIRKRNTKLDRKQIAIMENCVKDINDLIKNSSDRQRLYNTMNDLNYGKIYDEINTTWNEEINNNINYFNKLDAKKAKLESQKEKIINSLSKKDPVIKKMQEQIDDVSDGITNLSDELDILKARIKEQTYSTFIKKHKDGLNYGENSKKFQKYKSRFVSVDTIKAKILENKLKKLKAQSEITIKNINNKISKYKIKHINPEVQGITDKINKVNDTINKLKKELSDINKNGHTNMDSDTAKKLIGNLKIEFLEDGKVQNTLPPSKHPAATVGSAISDDSVARSKLNNLIGELLNASTDSDKEALSPLVKTFLDLSKSTSFVTPEYTKSYNLILPLKNFLIGKRSIEEFKAYVIKYDNADTYNSIVKSIQLSKYINQSEKDYLIAQYTKAHEILQECKKCYVKKDVFENKFGVTQYKEKFVFEMPKELRASLIKRVAELETNQVVNAIDNMKMRRDGILEHCDRIISLVNSNKAYRAKMNNYAKVKIDASDVASYLKREKAMTTWSRKIDANNALLKKLGYDEISNEFAIIKKIRNSIVSDSNAYGALSEMINNFGVEKFTHSYINDIDNSLRDTIKDIIDNPIEYRGNSLIKLKSIQSQMKFLKSLGLSDYDFYVKTYYDCIHSLLKSLSGKDYVGIVKEINKYSKGTGYDRLLNKVDTRLEIIKYLNNVFGLKITNKDIDVSTLKYMSDKQGISRFINDIFDSCDESQALKMFNLQYSGSIGNSFDSLYDRIKKILVDYDALSDKDPVLKNLYKDLSKKNSNILKRILNDKDGTLKNILTQPYITDNYEIINQYGESIFELKNGQIYDKSNRGIFKNKSSSTMLGVGSPIDTRIIDASKFVVDVETTGKDSTSRVWQVSVNYTINGKKFRKAYMIDPDTIDPKTIEEGANGLYDGGLISYAKGISKDYIASNGRFYTNEEIEDEISNLIINSNGVMVAHNANFDFNMLNKNGKFDNVDCIDTISLYKQMSNYFVATDGYTNFNIAKVMPSIRYEEVNAKGKMSIINPGAKDTSIVIRMEMEDGVQVPKLSTDGGKTFNNLHDAEVDTELTSICFDEALDMITSKNPNLTFRDLDVTQHSKNINNMYEESVMDHLINECKYTDMDGVLENIVDAFTLNTDGVYVYEEILSYASSLKAALTNKKNPIDIYEFESSLEQLLYYMKSATYSTHYDARGVVFEIEHLLKGGEYNLYYIDYIEQLLNDINQYRNKCINNDLITYKLLTNQEYFTPMYNRNYIHDMNILQYEDKEIQDLMNICLGNTDYFILKDNNSKLALAEIFNNDATKSIPEVKKLREAIENIRDSVEFEKQMRMFISEDLKDTKYIDLFSAMRNSICNYTGNNIPEIEIELENVINMYLNKFTQDDMPNIIKIKNKILDYAKTRLNNPYGIFAQPSGNFTSFIFNQLQDTLLQGLSGYSNASAAGQKLYDNVFSDVKISLSKIRDDLSNYRKGNKELSTHLINRDDVAGNLKLRRPNEEIDLNNIGNLIDNNCIFTFKKSSQLKYDGRLKSNIYSMFDGIFKPYDSKSGAAYVFSKDTLVGRNFNKLSGIFGVDYAYFVDSYKYRASKEMKEANKQFLKNFKNGTFPLPKGVNRKKLVDFINYIENTKDVPYIEDIEGYKNIYLNAVLDSIFRYGDILEGRYDNPKFNKINLLKLNTFNTTSSRRMIKPTVENYNQTRKFFINQDGTPDVKSFKNYLKHHKEHTLVWCDGNKLRKVNIKSNEDLAFALTYENSERIMFSIIDDDTYRGIAHDLNPQRLIDNNAYFDVYELNPDGSMSNKPLHHIKNTEENAEMIDQLKETVMKDPDKYMYKTDMSFKGKLGKALKYWWLIPSKVLQLAASLPFLVQNFVTAAIQNTILSGNPFDFFSFMFGCSGVAVRYNRYNRIMNSFLNNIDSNLVRDYILDINKNLKHGKKLDWVDILTKKGKSVIDELKQFALDKGFITADVEDVKFTKYFDDLGKCFDDIDYDDLKRIDRYMNYTSTMGYTAELNLSMDMYQRKQKAYEELKKLGDKDEIYLQNPDPNNGCKSLAEELKQLNEKLKNQKKLTSVEYKRRQRLYTLVNKDENTIFKKIRNAILTKGKRIPGTPAWTMDVNESIEHIVRIQALESMEAQGLTESLAKHKVIESHYLYNDKSKAEQLAEFFIPFISYPLRASSQLEQLTSDYDFVEFMYLWDKENWKDEDNGKSPYIAKRRAKGDIPVGNKLVSVGNPLTEAIYNLENPGDAINNKMNPIFKPIYDLATGAKYNRVNQLPIVSQVTNFYNLVANGDSQFTNDYYKFSYNKFYLPHQSYNRVYPRFYNSLYTKGGKSRIAMNMQPVNNNNLKYRVNAILKKY